MRALYHLMMFADARMPLLLPCALPVMPAQPDKPVHNAIIHKIHLGDNFMFLTLTEHKAISNMLFAFYTILPYKLEDHEKSSPPSL